MNQLELLKKKKDLEKKQIYLAISCPPRYLQLPPHYGMYSNQIFFSEAMLFMLYHVYVCVYE